MEVKFSVDGKLNTNILLSDSFAYELPSSFVRSDLLGVDIIVLTADHAGTYVIEQRILLENRNLIIKVKAQ